MDVDAPAPVESEKKEKKKSRKSEVVSRAPPAFATDRLMSLTDPFPTLSLIRLTERPLRARRQRSRRRTRRRRSRRPSKLSVHFPLFLSFASLASLASTLPSLSHLGPSHISLFAFRSAGHVLSCTFTHHTLLPLYWLSLSPFFAARFRLGSRSRVDMYDISSLNSGRVTSKELGRLGRGMICVREGVLGTDPSTGTQGHAWLPRSFLSLNTRPTPPARQHAFFAPISPSPSPPLIHHSPAGPPTRFLHPTSRLSVVELGRQQLHQLVATPLPSFAPPFPSPLPSRWLLPPTACPALLREGCTLPVCPEGRTRRCRGRR